MVYNWMTTCRPMRWLGIHRDDDDDDDDDRIKIQTANNIVEIV